ncbi:MAG: Rap1a/Tai family immunity protein [Pseudomonadota bacterium]
MKYLPLIFCLLMSTRGWAATPLDTHNPQQVITVDYFFEACTVIGETAYGMVPHFDCETYLYGILDTYQAVNAALPVTERACLPAKLAPWQLYEALSAIDSSTSGAENAAAFIVKALRNVYPCQ